MRMTFNKAVSEAKPTLAHMALTELTNRDICKFVMSQNIDGLHRRSGMNPEKLSELQGNAFLEVCEELRC